MEEEATRSGTGVDRIGQALELNAFLVKFSDQIYQVLNTPAKPVQLPDNKSVALAQGFLRLDETGTFGAASADLVLENLLAAGLGQGFDLHIEILILGGDASVADQHGLVPPLRPALFLSKLIQLVSK